MFIKAVRLEGILAERSMTKSELAEKSGLSRQSISTLIKRGTCEPRTAGKLAAALGISVDEIIGEAK